VSIWLQGDRYTEGYAAGCKHAYRLCINALDLEASRKPREIRNGFAALREIMVALLEAHDPKGADGARESK
jgi:hypothetical protein